VADVIIPLHANSGADAISSFLVKERRSYLIEYLIQMSVDLFFLLLDRHTQFPTGQLMI
jgi:hypothetical protein